jgi:cyclopropane-fatty-acyl-phospholipid synthase
MATAAMKKSDAAVQITVSFLQDVFGPSQVRDVTVRLWDNTLWRPEPAGQTRCTLVLQHPGALRSMFMPPTELNLAEAYLYNDFDIEGDLAAVVPLIKYFLGDANSRLGHLRHAAGLLRLPKTGAPRIGNEAAKLHGPVHSLDRDRQAISHHYDRSNDFFALWLDSRMIYSCAFFFTPDDDLESAQEQKLDYICRKMRLKPGDRLLDIGCGWGGLVMYAAQHYGVKAMGINISAKQVEFARKRIKKAGLEESCQVHLRDYREMNEPEAYDKVVATGAAEHVGKRLLPTFFKCAWDQLRPGGVFLNQSFTVHSTARHFLGRDFVHRYVYPDGEPIPLSVYLDAAESAGFHVHDVENLVHHYSHTLRHWLRRYEEHSNEARRIVGEATYRSWRVYLAMAIHEFDVGTTQVYQTLLAKSAKQGTCELPLTRHDWYS